jgi:hypothetical protein
MALRMVDGPRGHRTCVTRELEVVPRDDRAWPRGAVLISVVFGLVAIGAGVGLVVGAAGRGPLTVALVAVGLLAAFGYGFATLADAMRHWTAGRQVPGRSRLLELAGVVAAFAVLYGLDAIVGGAMLAGLIAGTLVANIWAIRRARSNRDHVDQAEAALERDQARAHSRPQSRRGGVGSATTSQASVDQALRHTVAIERQRCLAWLIAGSVATTACVLLDASAAATLVVVITGALTLTWVTRRYLAAWLAFRDFAKAAIPPRRAFVILLLDPAPKMIRPLLGVWSEPPVPRGGRLPKPHRVYRCDDERTALVCHQGSVVVHEAWVDTGPRPGSKPRWVAADAGIALPHRRSLFGRWYLSSLISGERPDPPQPLTLPPPHTEPQVITEDPDVGSLTAASAVRLAGLTALGLLFHRLT